MKTREESFISAIGTTIAVALLAALLPSTVTASTHGGGVAIYNACPYPVHSFTVQQGVGASVASILTPDKWYWEPYRYPDVGGVSLKLGKSNVLSNANPITQLEYKITDGLIYYDLSNIDCGPASKSSPGTVCPFTDAGMFLHADVGCDVKSCKAGDEHCHDAYNQPNDNWAVGACKSTNKNLVLYLCRSV